ncbi:S24 family peptidase [Sodalis sp. RH19]|uniref:HumD family translesion DNA polymerase n=1 Tax=Sodalis sp. RH19 TaxID=3394334 RepID=UPI0039B466EC
MTFPSPVQDCVAKRVSLDDACIHHPTTTFFMRASEGSSRAGIFQDSLLVVDKSLLPVDGSIIVAEIGGEISLRRVRLYPVRCLEKLDEPNEIILCEEGDDLMDEAPICWGVVTYVVNDMRTGEFDDTPCLF